MHSANSKHYLNYCEVQCIFILLHTAYEVNTDLLIDIKIQSCFECLLLFQDVPRHVPMI